MSARALIAGCCLAGLLGCGEAASDTDDASSEGLRGVLAGQDCVVLVLDALRADHVGAFGAKPSSTPHLDSLAIGGVRMTDAISQTSWTLPSTASLFTGLYQETHGLFFGIGIQPLLLVEEAVTLADLFAEAGYATHGWSQNTFASGTYGLDQGFEQFEMLNFWYDDGDVMSRQIAELLAQPSERPRFVYAHYRRPHTPYDPPGIAPETLVGEVPGTDAIITRHNNRERLSEAELERHHALYLEGLRTGDAHVGALLDALDLDKTLVVVLSDHGEAMNEHGKLGHNWSSWQEFVHIPMILRHPRLPGGTVLDDPVMTIDVLPTLAELFALDVEDLPLQGASLVPLMEGREAPRRAAVFSSSRVAGKGRQQMAAYDGRYKLVRQLPAGNDRLFDLEADPAETIDLSGQQPELTTRLGELLSKWVSSQRASLASETGKLSAEDLENLSRLGYVGSDDGH